MEIKFNKASYVVTDNSTFIKTILSNINLEIESAKITSIMGKSGSGKTTLVEMLDGLIIPTKGSIKIGSSIISIDNDTKVNTIREKIGIVFQNSHEQFFLDTVEKEISFAVKHLNKSVKNIKKHVLDALTMVGLDETYLSRNPFNLSNGERKKVAIASVLCANPKVLILDEPTIGLDNESIDSLIHLIRLLKKRYEKTIIIVSKNSDFVHKISDKVVVLCDGKIVLEGSKYDVFTKDIEKYGLKKPKIIEFEQYVRENKGIRLLYRDEINDLMKDIYRYASR